MLSLMANAKELAALEPLVQISAGEVQRERCAMSASAPAAVDVDRAFAHAGTIAAASVRPKCSIAASRSLYFWILPVTVSGNSVTNHT
jgi:hypothetical protein